MKKVIILMSGLMFVFAGCKKIITEPNSGLYRGTFFQIYETGDTNGQGIAYLSLNEGNNSFQMSGDSSTGAPYPCHGTYVINSSTLMTFYNAANVNVGYQPHYLLDTTYNYTFNDHNFTLDLDVDTVRYEYKLIRD